MSRQRTKSTAPEVALRRVLHSHGHRYRVGLKVPDVPRRSIDIAFTRLKLAVFVDGCFWHGCPEHGTWPSSNRNWWREKILRNRARDAETNDILKRAGWNVCRIWEHESVAVAVRRIEDILNR